MVTSNWKGQLAVSKAEVRAMEKGFIPNRPLMDCRYDMILDDRSRLWRVQVKSCTRVVSHCHGAVAVNLSYETRGRTHIYTYKQNEVNALVVYLPSIDKLCWFPPEIFIDKTALSVRLEPPLNGQTWGIVLASKYFW